MGRMLREVVDVGHEGKISTNCQTFSGKVTGVKI